MATVNGGHVSAGAGETEKGKNKNKSLGITLFWSGYGAFILFFIFHFPISSSGISYYSPFSIQSSVIHPFILALPLNLIT